MTNKITLYLLHVENHLSCSCLNNQRQRNVTNEAGPPERRKRRRRREKKTPNEKQKQNEVKRNEKEKWRDTRFTMTTCWFGVKHRKCVYTTVRCCILCVHYLRVNGRETVATVVSTDEWERSLTHMVPAHQSDIVHAIRIRCVRPPDTHELQMHIYVCLFVGEILFPSLQQMQNIIRFFLSCSPPFVHFTFRTVFFLATQKKMKRETKTFISLEFHVKRKICGNKNQKNEIESSAADSQRHWADKHGMALAIYTPKHTQPSDAA